MTTHCGNGHEYTAENTRWRNPTARRPRKTRVCLACERERYVPVPYSPEPAFELVPRTEMPRTVRFRKGYWDRLIGELAREPDPRKVAHVPLDGVAHVDLFSSIVAAARKAGLRVRLVFIDASLYIARV